MVIYLDIETIPTQCPVRRAWVEARRAIKTPDLDPRTAYEASSLDAALGEVIVIGAALDDRPVKTWSRNLGESESDLLIRFRADLDRVKTPVLVGHNVLDFDRKFLRQRGIVHGLWMPEIITCEIKPWETNRVVDTMRMWCGDHRGRISLDALCVALGLPGKCDVDGGDVWAMVQDGRVDDVATYCAQDVEKTRAAYLKMSSIRRES